MQCAIGVIPDVLQGVAKISTKCSSSESPNCKSDLGAMSKLDEGDQLKLLKSSSDHLVHADKERQEYKRQIAESRVAVDKNLKLGSHECCSFDGISHYSFDYAQQVHIPTQQVLIRLGLCIF